MKKLPYALGMLAAYLVLEFVVLRADALGTVRGQSGLQLLAAIVLLLGPIVLGALILVNRKTPVSGVAGVLCLVMAVCTGFQVMSQFGGYMAQLGAEVSGANVRSYLWRFAGGILTTVLLWSVGAKLQDGETDSWARSIALIGCLLILVQSGKYISAGIYPAHEYFPHLVASCFSEILLLLFYAELPTTLNQLGCVGAKKLTMKRIAVLAILTAVAVGLWIVRGRI